MVSGDRARDAKRECRRSNVVQPAYVGMIQRGDCPRLEFNGGKESPSQGQDIGAPSIALSGRNSPLDRYR